MTERKIDMDCNGQLSSVRKIRGDAVNSKAKGRVLDATPTAASVNPDKAQMLLKLQRAYGNRHVQRVLNVAPKDEGEAGVNPRVEDSITRKRGGGQALDKGVRGQMESFFDADFSGVRVHTDREADGLNRQLNARAFTTGQDIFFKEGAYNPGSSGGRELLAHELTHVVQQTGGLHRKMTLGQAGDIHEREADEAARAVMQQEQRANSIETASDKAQKQTDEQDKETLATKAQEATLQRQAEPEEEEEEIQAKSESGELRRQEEDEEETPASAKEELSGIKRQAEEEEEEEEPVSARHEQSQMQRQKGAMGED
jgi:hypothetical protein